MSLSVSGQIHELSSVQIIPCQVSAAGYVCTTSVLVINNIWSGLIYPSWAVSGRSLPLGEFVGRVAEAEWSGGGGHPWVVRAGSSSSCGHELKGDKTQALVSGHFQKATVV